MDKENQGQNPNIFPALRYSDALSAIKWLEQAFGFEEYFVASDSDGGIAHAQLKQGPGLIMLGSKSKAPDPDNPWGSVRQGIYMHVEDIDTHYERACSAGAEIVMKLQATEYGSREYSARDLEGNLWSFGTYQPLTQ